MRDTNATLLSVAAAEQAMVSRLLARSDSHAAASLSSSSSSSSLSDMLLDYGSTAIVGVLVPTASSSKAADAPSSSQNGANTGAELELNSCDTSAAMSSSSVGTTLYLANVGDSQCVLFERLHSCDAERAEDCQCVAPRSDRDDASALASSQSTSTAPTRGTRTAAKRKVAAMAVAAAAGSEATSTSVPGVCWNWKFLNAEHNPSTDESEKERVVRDGGKVFRNGAASGELLIALF